MPRRLSSCILCTTVEKLGRVRPSDMKRTVLSSGHQLLQWPVRVPISINCLTPRLLPRRLPRRDIKRVSGRSGLIGRDARMMRQRPGPRSRTPMGAGIWRQRPGTGFVLKLLYPRLQAGHVDLLLIDVGRTTLLRRGVRPGITLVFREA